MARFDELDEQAQQEWQARVAQKRLALSASVEETLQDSSLEVEEEFDEEEDKDEEEDEQVVSPAKDTRSTTLIPPRLSLQSKQLPAVHAQSTSRSTKLLSDPHSEEECEPTSVDNIHILARLTRQLAVVDGSISSTPYDSQNMPKIESVSSALPMTHKIPSLPHAQAIPASAMIPPSRPLDLTQVGAGIPRTLKRTTKVRLQVVPKPEPLERPADRSSPLCDAPTDPSLPTVKPGEERAGTIAEQVSVAGSGSFESGQAEVAVANTSIASSSVVVVVLTGDPGPVVVQYVSLQPDVGFTVHLSAPTKNATPFNYRIL